MFEWAEQMWLRTNPTKICREKKEKPFNAHTPYDIRRQKYQTKGNN